MTGLQQLQPDTLFAGDYRVLRPLAEGNMGAVYLVQQLSTSKHRALKLMQPELLKNSDARRRFELEAKIGSQIDSDHVVDVVHAGVDSQTGIPWLAMEFLEGQDLASYVATTGPLSVPVLVDLFGQLKHALGRAHNARIVHRDLKPENIFLAKPRRAGTAFVAKILDFGIAHVTAELKATLAKTKGVIGTPLWMAPEQHEPGLPIRPCTDVWALGLIAFWALTGRYFWKTAYADNAQYSMLLKEVSLSNLPTASRRAAEYDCIGRIPAGFDHWFSRCVSRDGDTRYRHADEACTELARILTPTQLSPPATTPPGIAKTAYVVAAAIVLVGIAVVFVLMFVSKQAHDRTALPEGSTAPTSMASAAPTSTPTTSETATGTESTTSIGTTSTASKSSGTHAPPKRPTSINDVPY